MNFGQLSFPTSSTKDIATFSVDFVMSDIYLTGFLSSRVMSASFEPGLGRCILEDPFIGPITQRLAKAYSIGYIWEKDIIYLEAIVFINHASKYLTRTFVDCPAKDAAKKSKKKGKEFDPYCKRKYHHAVERYINLDVSLRFVLQKL